MADETTCPKCGREYVRGEPGAQSMAWHVCTPDNVASGSDLIGTASDAASTETAHLRTALAAAEAEESKARACAERRGVEKAKLFEALADERTALLAERQARIVASEERDAALARATAAEARVAALAGAGEALLAALAEIGRGPRAGQPGCVDHMIKSQAAKREAEDALRAALGRTL